MFKYKFDVLKRMSMDDVVSNIVDFFLNKKVKYYDVRLQNKVSTNIILKDGSVEKINKSEDCGVGVRVLSDRAWGFSSTNDTSKKRLSEIADKAMRMSLLGRSEGICLSESKTVKAKIPMNVKIDPREVPLEEKISYLKDISNNAKINDDRIVNSNLTYSEEINHLQFRNSEGSGIEMTLPRIRLSYSVTSSYQGRLAWTRDGVSGSHGYELIQDKRLESKMRKVAYDSIELLKGDKTPAGKMPIIMGPDVVGLFVHEAFGHSNEADSILQGRSFLKNKLNEKIASEKVNIVSDPLLKEGTGYYEYDDEGTPARKVVLVDHGILRSYMHTRETAYKFGLQSTSNARAEDYSFEPIVRMNNLYVEPGDWTREEIIEDTKTGIYIKTGLGGMEDPERGAFQFNVNGCYLIENGEISKPLRNTCLAGFSIAALSSIDALGDQLGNFAGTCGKGEPSMQMVPNSNGGPAIRVNDIIVGGST